MRKSHLALLAIAPVAALALTATAAQASASATTSASTVFSGVTDSGFNGNWATDQFIDFTSVTGHGISVSCPSDARYAYTATDYDYGKSTTVIGDNSPGETSVLLARAVSAQMTGGWTGITFCASSDSPSAAGVPSHGGETLFSGTNGPGSQGWYARFFPHTAVIADFASTGWGWTYRLPQAPCGGHGLQTWRDDSSIPQATSGNILVESCHV